MGLWGMPDMIVEAIAFHHQPMAAPEKNDILTAVHAANVLAKPPSDEEADTGGKAFDQAYLEKLGLEQRFALWQQTCEKLSTKGAEN